MCKQFQFQKSISKIKFKDQIQKSKVKIKSQFIMLESNPFKEKIFNLDDRLVRFAGECIFFTRKLEKSYENE